MKNIAGLIDALRSYKSSHLLATSISLGMLAVFSKGEVTVEEVSKHCEISAGFSRIFLKVLSAHGLVEAAGKGFRLTSLGTEAIKSEMFCSFASYHMNVFPAWGELRHCCRPGAIGGGYHRRAMSDPQFCRSYLLAMESIAQSNVHVLLEICSSLFQGRILDLGAGPSTVGRQLAEIRDLLLTGIDFPPMIDTACKLFNYPENFTWIGEDFRNFTPVEPFNGVFCSHFLEYCPEGSLDLWLQKIGTFIKPHGKTAFVIFLRTKETEENIELDLFEISTGLNGDTLGHVCSFEEMEAALRKQGCTEIRCSPLPSGASYPEYLVTCTWK